MNELPHAEKTNAHKLQFCSVFYIVDTFLKFLLHSFKDQIRYVTPRTVHTLNKQFSGVCHYFYQDISDVMLAISS